MIRIYWHPLGYNTFDYFVYDEVSGAEIVIADYEQILGLTHTFYSRDQTKEIADYYSMAANTVMVLT